MRKSIIAATTAVLVGFGVLAGVPAQAGQGASQTCANGIGNETPLANWPVTLGVQRNPDGSTYVCYSTTPLGSPGGVGGLIAVAPSADLTTVKVQARATCTPDTAAVFAPSCETNTNGAAVGAPSYSTGPTTFASDTGGPCLWVLGVQYLATCSSATTVTYHVSDAPGVGLPSTGVCLLSEGTNPGNCYVYLTGVKVYSGYDSTKPVVSVVTPYTGRIDIDAPKACYGVLASCP